MPRLQAGVGKRILGQGLHKQGWLAALSDNPLGNTDELPEKGVRAVRSREKLGVELGANHERMLYQLHDFYQSTIRREPAGDEARLF